MNGTAVRINEGNKDWLWVTASYLFSFINLSYVLKEIAGGYIDPLLAAGLTALVTIVCLLLAVGYILKRAASANSENDVAYFVKSQRRLRTALAAVPVLICLVLLIVLVLFGKTALLAPADIRPTDGRNYQIEGGRVGHGPRVQNVHYDNCKSIHSLSSEELTNFANDNYGVTFRLQKRPSVSAVDIVGVRLTVQSIEEVPELDSTAAGPAIEPVVWAVQLPSAVHVGTQVNAELLEFDWHAKDGAREAFSKKMPFLPEEHSLPFIVRITCEKECLIYYKLEVLTDAGWRSSPIEVCDQVHVAFYLPNSKKLHFNNYAPTANENVGTEAPGPPAPAIKPAAKSPK